MTRKKQTAKHRRPNRRALVLLLVLIVIAMMSLAAYTFSELMFTEYQSAKVVGRQAQTRSFIHSAEAMLQNYLAQAPDDILQAGGTYDNSAQFGAVLIADDGTRAAAAASASSPRASKMAPSPASATAWKTNRPSSTSMRWHKWNSKRPAPAKLY